MLNTSFTARAFAPSALKNSRLLSAKSRWLTIGADGATLMPLSADDWFLDLKRHERPSAANKKRYGEIGSPCLIPRVGTKDSRQSPLSWTENKTDVTSFINLCCSARQLIRFWCEVCLIPYVWVVRVLDNLLDLDDFINDLYKQSIFWFNGCLNALFTIYCCSKN